MRWKTLDDLDWQSESEGSTGLAVASLSLIVGAVFLMGFPAAVATISMFDPGALQQGSSWLAQWSPAISMLDYVKAAVTVVSLAVVWKSRRVTMQERAVGALFARCFRAS